MTARRQRGVPFPFMHLRPSRIMSIPLAPSPADTFRRHLTGLAAGGIHSIVAASALISLLIQGDLPMRMLANLCGCSTANMTEVIDRLAAKGLVDRVRHATDRRIVTVRLLAKGISLLQRAGL